VLGPTVTSSVPLNNLAPGDEITGTLSAKNVGSLDGYLYGRTMYTVLVDPNLANKLTVTSWTDGTTTITPNMNLVEFAALGWQPYGLLEDVATYSFEITVKFDTDAGNDYQESSIEVWFELYLNQVNSSP
jgi:hypothetical protein